MVPGRGFFLCIDGGRGLILLPVSGGLIRKVGGSTEAAVNQRDPAESRVLVR